MPVCCGRRLSIWPLLRLSFLSILSILSITACTDQSIDAGMIIYLGFLAALFTLIAKHVFLVTSSSYRERDHSSEEENMITERRSSTRTTPRSAPRVMFHFGVGTSVMAERAQYRHGTFFVLPNFGRNAQIARMAIRALPPVKSFTGDKTSAGSQCECPICMENFKDGELIQPFGLCVHEFHSSCLNSWLHSGSTTCPVCREDLSTSIHARGT